MRSTIKEIRRRQRRVNKFRSLKNKYRNTKDLKERQKIFEKIQKISFYPITEKDLNS